MERGKGRYTTHQLYHHRPPNYFNLLHITADSYIIDALWPMYKNKIAWG